MAYDEGLTRRVREILAEEPGFDITSRPMKGWVMAAPAGYEAEADLWDWVARGVAFARTLPSK